MHNESTETAMTTSTATYNIVTQNRALLKTPYTSYMYVHTCTCMHIYIIIHTCICTCTGTYNYKHPCIMIQVHTYMCIYTLLKENPLFFQMPGLASTQ